MLIRWNEQKGWALFSVTFLIVASVAYILYSRTDSLGPRGGSWPGIAFGCIGLGMMAFAGLLTPRRKLRVLPFGKATFWMKGHLWFGALSLPIIFFHSGFEFGGPFTLTLMVLFFAVYISGFFGLVVQQLVPQMLLAQVSREMIYERIDPLVESLAESGMDSVKKCCGSFGKPLTAHLVVVSGPDNGTFILLPHEPVFLFGSKVPSPSPITDPKISPEHFEIRRRGKSYILSPVHGCDVLVNDQPIERHLLSDSDRILVGGSILQFFSPSSLEVQVLKSFFIEELQPYLTISPSKSVREKFRSEMDIRNAFHHIKKFLETDEFLQTLEELQDSVLFRRELLIGKKLHRWLHSWLIVHIPLSVVLLAGSVVHAVVSLIY
jgi:hypothetical protein